MANQKEYKQLGCKDFGADCDFMVRAQTAEEVAKYCRQHACSVHNKCETSPRIEEKIKSRIKDVWI
jgi:predicted small metal-binding protein